MSYSKEEVEKMKTARLSKMTEAEIIKTGKKQKSLTLLAFICCLVLGFLMFAGFILCIIFNSVWLIAFLISIASFFFAFWIWKPKMAKWDYRQWTLHKFELEIKRVNRTIIKTEQAIHEMETIDGKKIKYTEIIDSYTEYTDKLHAILNYQEIIQHRMYKFLVTFEDNSTKVYTAEEGTRNYNKLIMHLKDKSKQNENSKSLVSNQQQSSADELRKYKSLLDDGLITKEEYEKKKEQILNK